MVEEDLFYLCWEVEEEEEELIFQMALVEVEELQALSDEAWMAMVEVLVLPEQPPQEEVVVLVVEKIAVVEQEERTLAALP